MTLLVCLVHSCVDLGIVTFLRIKEKKVNDVPNISLCEITLQVGRKQLAAAQQEDLTLSECIAAADNARSKDSKVMFFWDGEVLMREWESTDKAWQIVFPKGFRDQILNLAHDHVLSGHLGIRKTYQSILRYHFWPGMKANVAGLLSFMSRRSGGRETEPENATCSVASDSCNGRTV